RRRGAPRRGRRRGGRRDGRRAAAGSGRGGACGRRYRPGSPRLVPGPDELLAPPGGEYLRGAERQGAGLLPLVGAERAEEGAGALAHRPGDAEVGEQRLGCESAAVRVEPAV